MRIRTALAVSCLATAMLMAGPAAHARSASSELIVDQADPIGDVKLFDDNGGKPTTAQRESVDLSRFTAARREDGVRFTFTLARITGTRTFNQMVEVQFEGRGADAFLLDAIANPRRKTGTAYFDNTACLLHVSVRRPTGTVRVDVPDGCLPTQPGILRAFAYTTSKNGAGPQFSKDTLRVPGTRQLR